ncbi:MAG: ion transporter, partial [Muribaculaceae bacterium]|nr:ion transporter [Muribaculaceae bacterium]
DSYKSGRPCWRRYPFTFMGATDLLSIIPVLGMINNKLSLTKIFRLVRIVAILKYSRYSDKDDLMLRVLKKNLSVIKTISIFMFLYVYISALMIYNIEPPINPSTGEETFSTFFDAVYWSVVTLTTVGYGDIYPVTLLGKIISICSMICGVGMIATVSSVVTAGIVEEINKINQSKSNVMAKVTIKGVYQMNGPKPFQRIIECSQSEVGYYTQLAGNKSKQAQWIQANFPGADTSRGFSMAFNFKYNI